MAGGRKQPTPAQRLFTFIPQSATMKNLCALLLILTTLHAAAQTEPAPRRNVLKWAPAALTLGSISINGERSYGKHSFTFRVGVPVASRHQFTIFEHSAAFSMRSAGLLAGYRRYWSKKSMQGFYCEPFVQYVRHVSSGTGTGNLGGRSVVLSYENKAAAAGAGVQLGVQFMVRKRVVIDVFALGPMMQLASNRFTAVEAGNLPWSSKEADDATARFNDFTGKTPFLRNRTSIAIDAEKRSATASFKGPLPGVRTGIAFGWRF